MTVRILPDKSLCLGIRLVRFFITLCLLNLQCGKQIDGLSAIRHFFVILPHKKRNLDITLRDSNFYEKGICIIDNHRRHHLYGT